MMISRLWLAFLVAYVLGTVGLLRLVLVGYSPKGLFEVIAG